MLVAHPANQFDPRAVRQHPVDHQAIWIELGEGLLGLLNVATAYGPEIVLREGLANQFADIAVVFNYQNIHLDPVLELLNAPYECFVTVS